jgi:uncharacterized C2H2 Zn-finger protein
LANDLYGLLTIVNRGFEMSTELISCNACGVIFENDKEKEEHVVKAHIKSTKGLKRAKIWASRML